MQMINQVTLKYSQMRGLGYFCVNIQGYHSAGVFHKFGLHADRDGLHWFVYSEAGVVCLKGNSAWGTLGCLGQVNDLVSLKTWHSVELVKDNNNGYWLAYVYDANFNGHAVAEILDDSDRIYFAQSTTEEGYDSSWSSDPHATAKFYHWRPQYWDYRIPGFQFWPRSSNGKISYIFDYPSNTFCPTWYGVNPNFNNDEDAWYAGTGGKVCNWLLFPSQHHYLPLTVR
jgi:hypothetical protein